MQSVAPRTGAWIETNTPQGSPRTRIVAPRTGAWIETHLRGNDVIKETVAPRTGAWIETLKDARHLTLTGEVAPRTGAWIETQNGQNWQINELGRSPHGSDQTRLGYLSPVNEQ